MRVVIVRGGRVPGHGSFAPGDSPDLPAKVATDLILGGHAISTDRNDTSPQPIEAGVVLTAEPVKPEEDSTLTEGGL